MIALSDVVHHATNAQVVFVRTVSTIVYAVATLVHRNTAFVVTRESIIENATNVSCKTNNRIVK